MAPPILRWIYLPLISISCVNLLLVLICFIFLFKKYGSYHRNFWIIEFQIEGGFLLLSIGNLLINISFQFDVSRPPTAFFWPWKVGTTMSSFASSLVETGFLSIFFERGFATIWMKHYENMNATALSSLLITFSVIYGMFSSSMWNIFIVDISFLIPVNFTVNILCACCSMLLWVINMKIRKAYLRLFGNMSLTQRYQIDENIKLLKRILPVIIPGVSVIILTGIVSILGHSGVIYVDYLDNTVLYMGLLNVYVFFGSICILLQDERIQSIINNYLQRENSVIPKNVLGEQIIQNINSDEYFKALQKVCIIQLYICYFGHNTSNLIIAATFFEYEHHHDAGHLFIVGSFSAATFHAQIFNCFWLIGAERLVATIKKENYEHCQNARTLVFITIITWTYSVISGISRHVFELGTLKVFVIITWLTYAITLFLLVALYFVNRRLSKICYNSTIHLSERYQIYENIRAINYIMPHILFVSIAILISTYLNQFVFNEDDDFTIYIYNVITNFFITISILYSFIVLKKSRVNEIFCCHLKAEHKEDSSVSHNVRVDPMGRPVVIRERGADLHFNQLKKAWT